jgi:hypothetical protein
MDPNLRTIRSKPETGTFDKHPRRWGVNDFEIQSSSVQGSYLQRDKTKLSGVSVSATQKTVLQNFSKKFLLAEKSQNNPHSHQ